MFGARRRLTGSRRPRWSDLRLWLGLLLILGSMFAGAYLLSADEESVSVWRASADLAVGDVPQVEPVLVRLGAASTAYLATTDTPIGRMRVPVAAGALLPAAAVGAAEPAHSRLVTLPVDALHAPVGLASGDVVDVWVAPDESSHPATASLVLAEAHVHAVDRENAGVGGEIPVVLDVDRAQAGVLIAVSRGVVSLVKVPLSAQRPPVQVRP